jgi:hypothetical protein
MGDWDVVKKRSINQWDVVSDRPISTITGKPLATAQEKGRQGIEAVRATGPIVGDILGPMFAPQFKGPGLAMKLLNVGSRTGGAAVGSGLGAVGSDVITGQDIDVGRAGKESLLAGAGEAGMSALGGGAKLLKPIFSMLPDATFTGSAVKKYINSQTQKVATDRAEKFLLDIAPESVKKGAENTKTMSVFVDKAFSENSHVYKLYEKALADAAEAQGGKVLIDDTQQFIGELFENARNELGPGATKAQIKNEALKGFNYSPQMKSYLEAIENVDGLSPKEIKYMLANVFQNKGWNKLNPISQEQRESLKSALMADMDKLTMQGFDAAGTKKFADEEFKALKKFNSVRRIYDQSMAVTNPATQARALQPQKLHDMIYANQKKLMDDPELANLWPKLEQEALSAQRAAQHITETSQEPGPLAMLSRGMGPAAGGYLFGPPGAVGVEVLGAATAWGLLEPAERSILKQAFKGMEKPIAKTALHLGGQEITMGKSH